MKDVFISHCANDASVATAVCDFLEAQGIACWIAPRDVTPGSAFEDQILNAIDHTQAMVVVLSTSSNESPFVKSEVNRTFTQRKPIFTLRAEDVRPSRALELYLATQQWVDGFPPPLNERLARFAAAIRALIGRTSGNALAAGEPQDADSLPRPMPDVGLSDVGAGHAGTSTRPERVGEIIRRDGSREHFNFISLANRHGQGPSLVVALDEEGKRVRYLELERIRRIDIVGPSQIRDREGRVLRNCWPRARIDLDPGGPLTNVFVNPHGLQGEWAWMYKTELWSGRVDDDVVSIILPRDPNAWIRKNE